MDQFFSIERKTFTCKKLKKGLFYQLMVPGDFILQEYKNQIKREAVLSGHTVSLPGWLHGPLQMFGPENGVCKGRTIIFLEGGDEKY